MRTPIGNRSSKAPALRRTSSSSAPPVAENWPTCPAGDSAGTTISNSGPSFRFSSREIGVPADQSACNLAESVALGAAELDTLGWRALRLPGARSVERAGPNWNDVRRRGKRRLTEDVNLCGSLSRSATRPRPRWEGAGSERSASGGDASSAGVRPRASVGEGANQFSTSSLRRRAPQPRPEARRRPARRRGRRSSPRRIERLAAGAVFGWFERAASISSPKRPKPR